MYIRITWGSCSSEDSDLVGQPRNEVRNIMEGGIYCSEKRFLYHGEVTPSVGMFSLILLFSLCVCVCVQGSVSDSFSLFFSNKGRGEVLTSMGGTDYLFSLRGVRGIWVFKIFRSINSDFPISCVMVESLIVFGTQLLIIRFQI